MIVPAVELALRPGWFLQQPAPVIAFGGSTTEADVVVDSRQEAEALGRRIALNPVASLTLVQVLRMHGALSATQALDVESLAYATLQGGAEFQRWNASRDRPAPIVVDPGEPILLERRGNAVQARLNRPSSRNAMSVEMRDAWVGMLEVLAADATIERLQIEAEGRCFSTGGELAEFGTRPDTASAHWIRSLRSPARLMAALGDRISVRLHGACIGSGIELAAFARDVRADGAAFFQLPEVGMGLIPGAGGTLGITRRIGRQRTAWLALSGKRISARIAFAWGLIDHMVDDQGTGETCPDQLF